MAPIRMASCMWNFSNSRGCSFQNRGKHCGQAQLRRHAMRRPCQGATGLLAHARQLSVFMTVRFQDGKWP